MTDFASPIIFDDYPSPFTMPSPPTVPKEIVGGDLKAENSNLGQYLYQNLFHPNTSSNNWSPSQMIDTQAMDTQAINNETFDFFSAASAGNMSVFTPAQPQPTVPTQSNWIGSSSFAPGPSASWPKLGGFDMDSTPSAGSGSSSTQSLPLRNSQHPNLVYPQPSAIPTSLLVSRQSTPQNAFSPASALSPAWSVKGIEGQHINMPPSCPPLSMEPGSTSQSPAIRAGTKLTSFDSDSHDEIDDHSDHGSHDAGDVYGFHEHEIQESVERNGMIWGMKVEDYRALSARERKRVRNRISARTFRAKRKEHLTSLETNLHDKDVRVKTAENEAARLRREVAELKRRLSKYEVV